MADRMLEVLRTEQKYLLSCMEAEQMSGRLDAVLHRDTHGGMNGYVVRSLYFDTLDDRDFNDKDGGFEMRRKVRLRIYNSNDQTAKLELKEKQGDLQRKRSLLMKRADAIRLVNGDYDALLDYDSEFAQEMYGRMVQMHYMPKCIVEYNRRAYVVRENDIRITLDGRLRASESNLNLFDENLNLYPVGDIDQVTMEVKFNRFILSYVKAVVSLGGQSQTSASKYCAARLATLGIM